MHPNSKLMFERHGVKHFQGKPTALEIGTEAFPSTFARCCEGLYSKWDTMDVF